MLLWREGIDIDGGVSALVLTILRNLLAPESSL